MSFGALDAWHQPGAQVGRYRLIDRLAVGGMAELFLGYTQSMHGFEKLVVLKRILPQFAENPDFVRMFLDEARLAATLDHPNIAHVYDIGEHQGSYFFSMEYVHGQSLLKVMRAVTKARRPLPLEHSLNVIIGTCSGLHYAHDKVGLDGTALGIVHRDISPPNLILTYDGTVKVVDFGIAKAATAKSNTAVGTLKGKIPYMAPEQCRSEPLDRRSDIFSIGIILYELTVGRRLFQAETEIAIIRKITSGGFPPPTSVHPSYPGELEAIVMRALQLNPDARYSTARDLQIDLEEFAREYKLAISSARLASFMEELFDEDARRMPVNTQLPPPEPVPQPPPPPHPSQHMVPQPSHPSHPSHYGAPPQPPPQHAAPPQPPPRSPAPAAPPSPPPQPAAPSGGSDMEAFANALSKVLDGDDGAATEEIGKGKPAVKRGFGIDLDNLQLEELDPAKYKK